MKRAQRKHRARLMIALLAVSLMAQPGKALEANPFARFLGNWRGYGQVVLTSGDAERINCRASYVPSQSNVLSLILVCATQSYRIEIRSRLIAEGREVRGDWTETTHQVTGSLVGQLANGSFEGSVAGPGFTAGLSLRSNGRRQLVSIRPQGEELQFSGVNIDLLREADR